MDNQIKKFYNKLPEASHPKKAFIAKVAAACQVSPHTVKSWIFTDRKPSPENYAILCEMTNGEIDTPERNTQE